MRADGYEPIVKGNPGRRRFGSYWESFGPKVNRRVALNSDLEYYHWLCLEGDPEIEAYCEQPILVSAMYAGKRHQSVLDFWIRYRSGTEEFLEVKYRSALADVRTIRQVSVQRDWCALNGYRHRIVTEECLESKVIWLRNWRQMLSYLVGSQPDEKLQSLIVESVSNGPQSIRSLESLVEAPWRGALRTEIFRLIHRGGVSSPDLANRPLGSELGVELGLPTL